MHENQSGMKSLLMEQKVDNYQELSHFRELFEKLMCDGNYHFLIQPQYFEDYKELW